MIMETPVDSDVLNENQHINDHHKKPFFDDGNHNHNDNDNYVYYV